MPKFAVYLRMKSVKYIKSTNPIVVEASDSSAAEAIAEEAYAQNACPSLLLDFDEEPHMVNGLELLDADVEETDDPVTEFTKPVEI